MKLTRVFCTGLASVMALAYAVSLQCTGDTAKKDPGIAAYPSVPGGHMAKKDPGIVAYPSAPGGPGPIVFSHLTHGARGSGYACRDCHTAASGKASTVTMEAIRHGQACGACHDGKTKGPRDRRTAAPIKDCSACHMPATDIVIILKRMDPVRFSHLRHLGIDTSKKVSKPVGFSCGDCHPTLFERAAGGPLGMEVPHVSGACAECHNGQKRRDGLPSAFAANTRCLTCHKPPGPPSTSTRSSGAGSSPP